MSTQSFREGVVSLMSIGLVRKLALIQWQSTVLASPLRAFLFAAILLRAKDPKVQCARVCETVVGLVLQGTQVMNADPWMHNKEVLHACKQLVVIMKDVEKSLDDVRDDFEGMRMKTEVAVEATTLGIKPSQA